MTGTAAAAAPVLPRYGEGALCDVFPSLAAALGLDGFANVLGVPELRGACLLLIDGLGAESLREHRDAAPTLVGLAGAGREAGADGTGVGGAGTAPPGTLTAGFPSTTVSSLTSLGTGLPPGGHGILGCTVAIPGKGVLLNHLKWNQPVDPLLWQPRRTVFERAAEQGATVSVVSEARFDGSGLTVAALRGGRYVSAATAPERVEQALRALEADECALVYTYVGDLDSAGHDHGTGSPQWRSALTSVDRLVQDFAARLPPGTGLFITGDHGMVDVPPDARYDADLEPELMDGVELLGGENRARHVYARPGAAADVLATWRERLGADAWVAARDEAVAAGWFGHVEAAALPRIGDVVAAMRSDRAVVTSLSTPDEAAQVGMHGSMTTREQFVPLLRVLA